MKTTYWRAITLAELTQLWGYQPLLPKGSNPNHLYLQVTKGNQPHKVGGGHFATGLELLSMIESGKSVHIIGTERLF